MKCRLCNRLARYFGTKENGHLETFFTISWEQVDPEEYRQRLKDGRTTWISPVCPECYKKHAGRPPLGLKDMNEIKKRKITKDKYYREKGY